MAIRNCQGPMLVFLHTPIRPTNRTASRHSSAGLWVSTIYPPRSILQRNFEVCRPFTISGLNVFQRNVAIFRKVLPFYLSWQCGDFFTKIPIYFAEAKNTYQNEHDQPTNTTRTFDFEEQI